MLTNSKLAFLRCSVASTSQVEKATVMIVDSGLDVQEVVTKSPDSFIFFYMCNLFVKYLHFAPGIQKIKSFLVGFPFMYSHNAWGFSIFVLK